MLTLDKIRNINILFEIREKLVENPDFVLQTGLETTKHILAENPTCFYTLQWQQSIKTGPKSVLALLQSTNDGLTTSQPFSKVLD